MDGQPVVQPCRRHPRCASPSANAAVLEFIALSLLFLVPLTYLGRPFIVYRSKRAAGANR